MNGLSDELNEEIQGFGLKQTRDRLKVMELKSKIKAHQGWIEHDSKMVRAAKDALKEYEEDGFKSSYHKEHLLKMRNEAQTSLLRNKNAIGRDMKTLEKIVAVVGSKPKYRGKRERSPIEFDKQAKSSKWDDDKWAPNQYIPSVSEMKFSDSSDGWNYE